MPFARGTVNGVTGLLRKAGSFVKACCCKKWKCDTTTSTCTEDPDGPYNTERECKQQCKKYKCDVTTYDCTEDPLGAYDTLKECEDNCKEEKYYCCGSYGSPDDRDCYPQPCEELGLAPYGVYDTPEECDDECKVTHYKCNVTTYDCTEDPTGPYTDPKVCEDNCNPPPTYKCDVTNYDCTEDPLGPYDTLKECLDNCKEPRYYCCGSYGNPDDRDCYDQPCDELGLASYGDYGTQRECDANCKTTYYCCGSYGSPEDRDCYTQPCDELGLASYGVYYTQKECEDECKVTYYCCGSPGSPDDRGCYTQPCDELGLDPFGEYKTQQECDDGCKTYYCCGSPGNPDDRGCYTQPCGELGLDSYGEYKTEKECEGECKTGYCCTDYGISSVFRKQCSDWGGTFYTDLYLAQADCGCDCDVGRDYCLGVTDDDLDRCDGSARPDSPDGQCGPGPNSGLESEYYASGRWETGGPVALECPGDCPPLADLRAKNARIIGWYDTAEEFSREASDECCVGKAKGTRLEYRVFALNCRKQEWEEAPNVMAVFNTFIEVNFPLDPAKFCYTATGDYPPGTPSTPQAEVRYGTWPTCVPPEVNPLP